VKKKTSKRRREVKKKTSKKKAPPALRADWIEGVVLLAVAGLAGAVLRAQAVETLNVPPARVDEVIDQARRQITLAADYHRDTELGQAITATRALYRRAYQDRDTKTALACRKELSALLRLNRRPDKPEADQPADAPAEAILRAHLEPLGISTPDDSTEELARKTVAHVVDLRTKIRRQEGRGR
jgi:hypothetical protein